MPRKLSILAAAIVVLHIVGVLVLGRSVAGSLFGNTLQNLSAFAAMFVCWSAMRRASGFARSFWGLVGAGVGVWGVANLGWTYYEVVLHREPPELSFVRFLFDTQGAFFAMAILLDQDQSEKEVDPGFLIDALQLVIIFLFVFAGLYYVPSLALNPGDALIREYWVALGQLGVLFIIALLRRSLTASREAKRLYGGLAAYLLVYTLGSGSAYLIQWRVESPTGTFMDLCWSIPLLWAMLWAASWKPAATLTPDPTPRTKTLAETVLTNALFGIAPVIVFLLSAGLGPDWETLRYSLLAVSLLCYVARMALTDYRQSRHADTVRKQAKALDFAVDGMAIVGADGKYSYVNAGYAEMLGTASRDDMIGKTWDKVSIKAAHGPAPDEIRAALLRDGRWFGIAEISRAGKLIPVELAVTSLPEGGVVLLSRDLTERRRAERARADAEIKYQMIVEKVAAISYIAEPGITGRWYYVSPQIETILGYTQEEWLLQSEHWLKFVHPDDRPAVEEAERIAEKKHSFQAEYRMSRKDGSTIWVSDTATIVQGSANHPVMEGLLVDISERKLMEMQSQQARRMEAVGRLAGGIAHDFNNLLTIIKGYTELARQRTEGQPALRNDIERIEDASERAAALVRQLLAFSRKQVLQPRNLDLNGIVRGLEQLLRRLLGEDIRLQTALGADLGTIKADPSQIEQVLMNLVVNARDAMPNGGKLIVETCNAELDPAYASEHIAVKAGPYVMLAVSDTGVGMSAETVAHIFEPFFTTKGGTRGTGLGLATTYGIVKQSGGYIWVYSEPGRGTTFKVYLPRLDERAEPLPAARLRSGAQRGTETILLVEDDDAVRELTETVLRSYGYNVIVSEDPQHAQRLSADPALDIRLVLTDVVMPSMSGRELVQKLLARHPHMRVLYMSGYTDNVISSGGVLEPGLAFLQKPFTPAALALKVREVLDAVAPAAR
ncbi:MAG TPA: PAS domain S-box protein [Dongiaceae bacterium]|nr:PAS domain S-box protein [Dongiaceae bacterium]